MPQATEEVFLEPILVLQRHREGGSLPARPWLPVSRTDQINHFLPVVVVQ